MDDATAAGLLRGGRRMEDEGCVSPDVPGIGMAGAGFEAGNDPAKLRFRNAAKAVGAGGDQQRGIVCVDGIDVDAQGQHAFEQVDWRHDVMDAGFEGPVGKAGHVALVTNGNGAVLMPAERPISLRRLVEQGGTDRAGGGAEQGAGELGGGSDLNSKPRSAAEAGAWPCGICGSEMMGELGKCSGLKDAWEQLGSVDGELHRGS